ncbi:hypothetical protein IMZ48_40230 [Candidatus Bathyarchaeota archaeon]|nr:hypothetical protein [Candidatus Bathyarchaeota archaeon]
MRPKKDPHLGVDSRCGICTGYIEIDEKVIVRKFHPRLSPYSFTPWLTSSIVKGQGATSYAAAHETEAFNYPADTAPDSPIHLENEILCRTLTCRKPGHLKMEHVTIHDDCQMVLWEAALEKGVGHEFPDLVWMAAAWRKPAPMLAPTRLIDSSTSMLDSRFLGPAARDLGFPLLANMPLELLLHIRGYSADAPFWRRTRVMAFLENVRSIKLGPTLSMPFTQIETWIRDEPVLPYRSSKLDPVIRITVDVHGIKNVERLPEMPTYNGETFHDRMFIVAPKEVFNTTTATLKVCFPLLSRANARPLTPTTEWPDEARPRGEAGVREGLHTPQDV